MLLSMKINVNVEIIEDMSTDFNWVAQDEDGGWYAFEKKPEINHTDNQWDDTDDKKENIKLRELCDMVAPDWETSLTKCTVIPNKGCILEVKKSTISKKSTLVRFDKFKDNKLNKIIDADGEEWGVFCVAKKINGE